MCNITNLMIQECKYSALTKRNHLLRHIKVELIILLFSVHVCNTLCYTEYISVFFSGEMAQTSGYGGYHYIHVYKYICIQSLLTELPFHRPVRL